MRSEIQATITKGLLLKVQAARSLALQILAVLGVAWLAGCRPEPTILIQKHIAQPMGVAFCNQKIFVINGGDASVGVFDPRGNFIKSIQGFAQPMDLACRDGRLFVADFASDRIIGLDTNGKVLSSFGGKGDGPGQFAAPSGIALADRYIYVAEFYNHRIQQLTQDGRHVRFIGSKGHKDKDLFYPTDIFLRNGLLYVADAYNHRVQVYSDSGDWKKSYTSQKFGLRVPSGIVVTARGLFVADSENHRVVLISEDDAENAGIKTLWRARAGKAYSPTRLDLDPKNRLMIVDTAGDRLLRLP